MFKCSAEKTNKKLEIMLVCLSNGITLVGSESADICQTSTPFQSSVKYLGVHLDQTLSMKQHINSLRCTALLTVTKIALVRPCLSDSSTTKLVSCMVISRLDHCKAPFAGAANKQIARLQKSQNNAVRLVTKKNRSAIMSPLLKQPHCLSVKYRIRYKLATLTIRYFGDTLPPYLISSFVNYQPLRSLRSPTERLLKIPNSKETFENFR